MLKTKEVIMRWNPKIKNYYVNLDYLFTKMGDEFVVKVEDLSKYSSKYVEVLCDYCLEEGIETIVPKPYRDYTSQNEMSIIHKDCCKKCISKKVIESNIMIHGVKNVMELKSSKDKIKETNILRYNVENTFQSEYHKEKIKETMKDRYGVEHALQNSDIYEKLKLKYIDKYGASTPLLNEEIKEKIINTNLEKFGCENPFGNKDIQEKIKNTLYQNGTQKCSKQQKYIHKLIGGELNYPISRCSLDIAFLNDNIYVEYNGGGHDLKVTLGKITKEEFENKEIKREIFLKQNNWKLIRIISKQDYLPSDDKIIEIIAYAKYYLNTGHSWIEFDIDNQLIKYSKFEEYYNFGDLRRIS